MLALQSHLPVLSEVTGKPEWPNLHAVEKPLLHGNHECNLYANEGNRFAWVSNDAYHMRRSYHYGKWCLSSMHGWLGLETIEPKSYGTWKHDNVIDNLMKVI